MNWMLLRLLAPLVLVAMVGTYEWLPEQVGDPGHQGTRLVFFVVMLVTVLHVGLLCPPFMQWFGRRHPGLVNLPHPAYWMAPERRDATLTRLGEHMAGMGLWLVVLVAGLYASALRQGQPQWPWPPIEAWFAGATALALWFVLWVLQIYRLFPAPPRESTVEDGRLSTRRPRRPSKTPR